MTAALTPLSYEAPCIWVGNTEAIPAIFAALESAGFRVAQLDEIDGVEWCTTHDSDWYEGDSTCRHPVESTECVGTPIYADLPEEGS